MALRIGQLMRDPKTGDLGRVVGFNRDDQPFSRTKGGRLFVGGKSLAGRPQTLSDRYFDGQVKVCNCASCRKELLAACHADELRVAQLIGESVNGLPPLVAGRVADRPYCSTCLPFFQIEVSTDECL